MIKLRRVPKKLAYYSNILGMYASWVGVTLGAIVGAGRAFPIAGKGYSTVSIIETGIQLVVIFGACVLIVSIGLMFFGLIKYAKELS